MSKDRKYNLSDPWVQTMEDRPWLVWKEIVFVAILSIRKTSMYFCVQGIFQFHTP